MAGPAIKEPAHPKATQKQSLKIGSLARFMASDNSLTKDG